MQENHKTPAPLYWQKKNKHTRRRLFIRWPDCTCRLCKKTITKKLLTSERDRERARKKEKYCKRTERERERIAKKEKGVHTHTHKEREKQ